MNSIYVVLVVGAFAAVALAIPFSPTEDVENLRKGNSSKEINGKLCFVGSTRKFPDEGVVCKCRGFILGRWNCTPSNNTDATTPTTSTTTPLPTTEAEESTTTTEAPITMIPTFPTTTEQ